MRRTTGAVLASVLALSATAACADDAKTARGTSSPSPSPTCAGEAAITAFDSIRFRSRFETEGDLNVLVIAAGEEICRHPDDPDPSAGVPISMTFVRYGGAGARSTALDAAQPVGRYDGRTQLRVPVPVLGSPCTGAVMHVGTQLPKNLLPKSRKIIGVISGPAIYRMSDLTLLDGVDSVGETMFNPIIAVDNAGGKQCQLTVAPR